jgi:hypothetical protein
MYCIWYIPQVHNVAFDRSNLLRAKLPPFFHTACPTHTTLLSQQHGPAFCCKKVEMVECRDDLGQILEPNSQETQEGLNCSINIRNHISCGWESKGGCKIVPIDICPTDIPNSTPAWLTYSCAIFNVPFVMVALQKLLLSVSFAWDVHQRLRIEQHIFCGHRCLIQSFFTIPCYRFPSEASQKKYVSLLSNGTYRRFLW